MPSLPQRLQLSASAALSLGMFGLPCWLFGQAVAITPPDLLQQPAAPIATFSAVDDGPRAVHLAPAPERTLDAAADDLAAASAPAPEAPAQQSPAPAAAPEAPPPLEEAAPTPEEAQPQLAVAAPPAVGPASRGPRFAVADDLPAEQSARDDARSRDMRARVEARRAEHRAQREAAEAAARADAAHRAAAFSVAERSLKPPTRKKRQCLQGDNPDIESVQPGVFRVARSLVDYYTGDLKEAAKLATVAWHRDDSGRIDGFRIRRIRCGSVLHEAGLRNGDVVHSVNGRPVRNIPQALAAYRKLRKKRQLKLDVTRKGESVGLKYTLS